MSKPISQEQAKKLRDIQWTLSGLEHQLKSIKSTHQAAKDLYLNSIVGETYPEGTQPKNPTNSVKLSYAAALMAGADSSRAAITSKIHDLSMDYETLGYKDETTSNRISNLHLDLGALDEDSKLFGNQKNIADSAKSAVKKDLLRQSIKNSGKHFMGGE